MLTGKRAVLQWFDASDGNYWKIYAYGQASNGANIVYQSCQEENITHQKAREELDEALNILNGKFDIASTQLASRKPKGDWKVSFQINQAEEKGGNIGNVPQMQAVQGIGEDEVNKRIKAAIAEYKRDVEFEQLQARTRELEKQLKEAEKEASDPWNKIGEIAVPFITTWMAGQQQRAQVAGFPPVSTSVPENDHFNEETETAVQETIKLTEDEENRLSNVIAILYTASPEWLNKLEKLAALVQQNPAMINMI